MMSYFVYFIRQQGQDVFKIGRTASMYQRLKSLQGGNPGLLEIYGTFRFDTRQEQIRFEKELHEKFADYRLRGEWFALSTGQVNDILKDPRNTFVTDGVELDVDGIPTYIYKGSTDTLYIYLNRAGLVYIGAAVWFGNNLMVNFDKIIDDYSGDDRQRLLAVKQDCIDKAMACLDRPRPWMLNE